MSAGQPTVTYKPIPGHTAYRVGDDGTIWSSWHKSGPRNRGRGSQLVPGGLWRLLRAMTDKHGRKSVKLRPGKRQAFVHQLVLEAFVGPCPAGMEACHFPDRNPSNNSLSNLRWDTHAANAGDQVRHGTDPKGERHGRAKLTAEHAVAIRAEYAAGGITQAQLAAKYGLTQPQINRIITRKRWAHLS